MTGITDKQVGAKLGAGRDMPDNIWTEQSRKGTRMQERGDDMTPLESRGTSLAVTCHEPERLETRGGQK